MLRVNMLILFTHVHIYVLSVCVQMPRIHFFFCCHMLEIVDEKGSDSLKEHQTLRVMQQYLLTVTMMKVLNYLVLDAGKPRKRRQTEECKHCTQHDLLNQYMHYATSTTFLYIYYMYLISPISRSNRTQSSSPAKARLDQQQR